jgi:arsenate reductase
MASKLRILFLCTGNSCRSQMAEGWARHLKGEHIDVWSAGTQTHGLNPHAVVMMKEAGIDISRHRSKLLDEFKNQHFDYVITVCDNAKQTCPVFSGAGEIIHAGFADPPLMAEKYDDPQKKLECYRKVRDEIKEYVLTFPEGLYHGKRLGQ